MAQRGIFAGINVSLLLDSIRTAITAVAAMLVARLLKLPEFYWAPISAIVVIQSTIPPLTLGWQRFVGTAVGVFIAAVIATFWNAGVLAYGVGVVVCGIVAYAIRVGGAYRFAAIGLSIVLLISHAASPWIIAWHRFLQVSLGIAVALLMTVIWPAPKNP
jgi:uncharacterized membrane protein YgaE (UPF0421/DUF939 family)